MRFYYINDQYIDFLTQYETKVAANKHETRPYVGIVLEINSVKYYAPCTSPKPKHKSMKNMKDFRKIKNGEYGAINFNNMIPVADEALILIDIPHLSDVKYRRLLENQYSAICADAVEIKATAQKLRNLIFTKDELLSNYDKVVKQRCCNLPLLEGVYRNWRLK